MNDDWRVQVTCPTPAAADEFGALLRQGGFQHDLENAAGERVIVSVDGHDVFLYAGTRAQAERAAAAVAAQLAGSGVAVEASLRRWHPVAEEWADPNAPLPASPSDVAAEHAELIARERADQGGLAHAAWEVRVSTPSHRATLELADALAREGIPALRRWRFLLVGAADEDQAKGLAARVRALAGDEARVEVEASYASVEAEVANPFAVFGGLGG